MPIKIQSDLPVKEILEKENSNAEFIGLLRQERASLLELESDYKV